MRTLFLARIVSSVRVTTSSSSVAGITTYPVPVGQHIVVRMTTPPMLIDSPMRSDAKRPPMSRA
jgi:hypothetical protein